MQALSVAPLALALVFGWSGIAKLRNPGASADAFVDLRVPPVPPRLGARVLPLVELALALALLFARGTALVAAAGLTAALVAAYWLLIARAWHSPNPVNCACLGSSAPVSGYDVIRNTVLVQLAALALLHAGGGTSTAHALAGLGRTGLLWLAFCLLLGALGWSLAPRGGIRPLIPDAELEDYLRSPIPHASVYSMEEIPSTILNLANDKPRLLAFLSTTCSSCVVAAKQIDGWAELLAPAVAVHPVYADTAREEILPTHSSAATLFEPGGNVRTALGVAALPAAVLLGADGMLAGGPVYGEKQIGALVTQIHSQLLEAGLTQR